MKVLVTGVHGFIGKNLSLFLKNNGHDVLGIDIDNLNELDSFVKEADFIINLAGINRPLNVQEFYDGNVNSLVKLVELVKKEERVIPIMLASSTQAEFDNDYGKSKKQAEDYLFNYQQVTGRPVYVYRFQNVFGKWCKPNYNSVVATFCYNIAHNLEIKINDGSVIKEFVYIDDICKNLLNLVQSSDYKGSNTICYVKPTYMKSIGELASLIESFKKSRSDLIIPLQDNGFVSKLYATYLSYLEEDNFVYSLNPHIDNRGSFTEVLRTNDAGQVSINVGKPNIVKGNHYHNTKNEKYLVLKGTCSIKFRKVGTDQVIEYIVKGEDMRVVDIPTGYTHSITNIGKEDSITLMWASEPFDPNNPDTYFEEVIIHEKA